MVSKSLSAGVLSQTPCPVVAPNPWRWVWAPPRFKNWQILISNRALAGQGEVDEGGFLLASHLRGCSCLPFSTAGLVEVPSLFDARHKPSVFLRLAASDRIAIKTRNEYVCVCVCVGGWVCVRDRQNHRVLHTAGRFGSRQGLGDCPFGDKKARNRCQDR